MRNVLSRKLNLAFLMVIGILWGATSAIAGLPDATTMLEWNDQLKVYENGMVSITEEIKESVARYASPDINPADRWAQAIVFDKQLEKLDAPTRVKVMPDFINAVNAHFNNKKALIDTGGTKAGEKGFRYGFGDYDLEAPEENVEFIVSLLKRLVPVSKIEDHGSYIEVEHLRLIVFKKRPIETLADFEKYSGSKLERAAGDKEVYLHLRLPSASNQPDETREAYTKLVTALEIQGHIKKGIEPALAHPQDLIDKPEQLQTFAKSALKSIKALIKSGMSETQVEQEITKVLESVGFKGSYLPKTAKATTKYRLFRSQLRNLKGWAYLNPYMWGLTRENAAVFQKAVRGVLDMADARSEMIAGEALKALDMLQKNQPGDPQLVPLIIASKLYKKQRDINQLKLKGLLADDTVDALLAFFGLPEDYEITVASGGALNLIGSKWPGAQSRIGGRKYATATWHNYDPLEHNKRSWGPIKQAGQTVSINIAIVEYAAEKDAESAYKSAIAYESLQAVEIASQKESINILRQIKDGINRSSSHETYTLQLELDYKSGETLTEHLGTQQRSVVSIDFADAKASLVSLDQLVPLIRETTIATAELLTPADDIAKMKENARISVPGSLAEQFNLKPVLTARFKVNKESSLALVDSDIPVYRIKQGVLQFGKCVVHIELMNSFEHAEISDNEHNSHIESDLSEVSEWSSVEKNFIRLAARKAPLDVRIGVRLDGLDSLFKGIAADGLSELKIVADIWATEKSLKQISSTNWEIKTYAIDQAKGTVMNAVAGGIERAGSGHGVVTAKFKAPEDMAGEHREEIRLSLQTKNGQIFYSKWVPVQIFHPPIIFVHGVWSAVDAMEPISHFLRDAGAAPLYFFAKYHQNSIGPLKGNAVIVRHEIIRALDAMVQKNIKASRVNIVAHSLGGILSRMVILGWGNAPLLPGDGDKVYKLVTIATPHMGSHVANWYMEYNPDELKESTDPRLKDYESLLRLARYLENLRDDALSYGPAIGPLRANNNPFLERLNKAQASSVHKHIRYYVMGGTKPLLSETQAKLVPTCITATKFAKDCWESNSALISALEFIDTPRSRAMLNELFVWLSYPESDGVVRLHSAIPNRTVFSNLSGQFTVKENHFTIMANREVLSMTYGYLTDLDNIPAIRGIGKQKPVNVTDATTGENKARDRLTTQRAKLADGLVSEEKALQTEVSLLTGQTENGRSEIDVRKLDLTREQLAENRRQQIEMHQRLRKANAEWIGTVDMTGLRNNSHLRDQIDTDLGWMMQSTEEQERLQRDLGGARLGSSNQN